MKLKLMCDADILFDSTTNMYKAMSIDLTEQVNTTNTLVFALPPFNPNYDKPQKMTSVIEYIEMMPLCLRGGCCIPMMIFWAIEHLLARVL